MKSHPYKPLLLGPPPRIGVPTLFARKTAIHLFIVASLVVVFGTIIGQLTGGKSLEIAITVMSIVLAVCFLVLALICAGQEIFFNPAKERRFTPRMEIFMLSIAILVEAAIVSLTSTATVIRYGIRTVTVTFAWFALLGTLYAGSLAIETQRERQYRNNAVYYDLRVGVPMGQDQTTSI